MDSGGFFKLRSLRNKKVLTLKGNFDKDNIPWVKRALLVSGHANSNYLELNMRDVESINIQAMTLLVITLKRINEKGVRTRVTGLEGKVLELASTLGMQHITPIN